MCARFTKEVAIKELENAKRYVNGFDCAERFANMKAEENPVLFMFVKYVQLQNIKQVAEAMNAANIREQNGSKMQPPNISYYLQCNFDNVDADIQFLARYILEKNRRGVNARYN